MLRARLHRWLSRAYTLLRHPVWSLRRAPQMISDAIKRHRLGMNEYDKFSKLENLSKTQLLSLGRHEAHRIEKAYYNNGFERKSPYYLATRDKIKQILGILNERQAFSPDHPIVCWINSIVDSYDDIGHQFVDRFSSPVPTMNLKEARPFIEFLSSRRSSRVWADQQPGREEMLRIAKLLVEAASWAPCSGDRQPWRFRIIIEQGEKELLKGLKEPHCIKAPLLIYVGMDKSVYGAFGKNELGVYIDAGAAIMQMILLAERIGLASCWNHFARDLIYARAGNPDVYRNFVKKLKIPEELEPVAIVCVGVAQMVPPRPPRLSVEELIVPSEVNG